MADIKNEKIRVLLEKKEKKSKKKSDSKVSPCVFLPVLKG